MRRRFASLLRRFANRLAPPEPVRVEVSLDVDALDEAIDRAVRRLLGRDRRPWESDPDDWKR